MQRYPAARTLAGWALLLLAVLLSVGILTAAVASPASAQNATDDGNDTEAECTEHIDRLVSLCSAEYVDGEAVLELEADANQRIVLTDAAGVMQGGEVTREEFVIRGRSTVRMPVTEYDGIAAVTVDTGRVLFAVPLEDGDPMFGGEATWATAQVAGAGGVVGVLLVTGLLAWRLRDGGREEVKRRA